MVVIRIPKDSERLEEERHVQVQEWTFFSVLEIAGKSSPVCEGLYS